MDYQRDGLDMSGILQGLLASVGGAPEFNYLASSLTQLGSVASTTTFSGFDIGTAGGARRVVVFVNFYATSSATSLSSVTVAGQATSIAVTATNGRSVSAICITVDPVTSGTTGDVVVTASANFFEVGISTYSALNLNSTTPTDTDSATSSGVTRAIDVLANGGVFGNGGSRGNTGTGGSITWTNLTRNYFIDGYDTVIGYRTSGASYTAAGAAETRSVTCTMADEADPVVCYASFR
jgi:hypothetical protein